MHAFPSGFQCSLIRVEQDEKQKLEQSWIQKKPNKSSTQSTAGRVKTLHFFNKHIVYYLYSSACILYTVFALHSQY